MKQPSELDKRASEGFQALASESAFFAVECRFRKLFRRYGRAEHPFWAKGAEEFRKHFGNGASYFAGVLEYVHLATGWAYPFKALMVVVFDGKKRRTSSGVAFRIGLSAKPINHHAGEIRVFWANGEFTLTVLHELVHLFKKDMDEDWVEQQAVKLVMGV